MNIDYTLWPNTDGNLGNIKVQIPTGIGDDKWPEGDALVHNFVYKDGKLAGFVDTKALTVNDSKSTIINYDYVNIHLDSIKEGDITFNRGERSKYFTVTYSSGSGNESFDFVIIDFNTTDQETINTVRTAKRVVDNKLYDADGGLIGTLDTSKIEVGGKLENADGLFCNMEAGSETMRGLILSEFDSDLSSLRDGSTMFVGCSNLTSFNGDLSRLTNGNGMFCGCSLTSFSSDLSSLTDGFQMFALCPLTSFSSDLSSLTNGNNMFGFCSFTSFNSNLSNLTNGFEMFWRCTELASFSSDLSSLTNGNGMFENCFNLTSFTSDLPSLTNGFEMFKSCKLDTASVQNIADTIKNVTSLTNGSSEEDEVYKVIKFSIGNPIPNDQETAAFNSIAAKGWTVYANSYTYTPSSASSIMTLDELGNEVETPIPYYAKPVPATEKTARYVDANGNFFNILGAQFIYGDDLSTYGMFTCEEDAAANMRLTKIEKPSISKFALNH